MNEQTKKLEISIIAFADFAWKESNPNSKFDKPPSMIYEQVERIWKLYSLEEYINSLLSQQKRELVERIHELWNYPCSCIRRQEVCIHNYDQMFSIISSITQ